VTVVVTIVFIWLAVLSDAVYGADLVGRHASRTQSTTIPSAVFVGFFVFLGSLVGAERAFRRGDGPRP
jgi:hypothetical protein